MNHTVLKCVTSHAKTCTNGFVLNGQKPTERKKGYQRFQRVHRNFQRLVTFSKWFVMIFPKPFQNAFNGLPNGFIFFNG